MVAVSYHEVVSGRPLGVMNSIEYLERFWNDGLEQITTLRFGEKTSKKIEILQLSFAVVLILGWGHIVLAASDCYINTWLGYRLMREVIFVVFVGKNRVCCRTS